MSKVKAGGDRKARTRKPILKGAAAVNARKGEGKTALYAAAWKLRVEGATFREVGEKMGIPLRTAHDWCRKAREANQQEAAEIRKDAREQALERLQPAAARAARLYEETGRADHARALAALEKRIAELVGSDAPKQVQVSGHDGGPLRYAVMTDEELRREAGE